MSAKLRGPVWLTMDCSCSLLMTAGTDGATACPRCGRRWGVVVMLVQDGASEPTDTLDDVLAAKGAR